MTEGPHGESRPFLLSRAGIALLGFTALAGFFLWQEHRAHLLGFLPYALLARREEHEPLAAFGDAYARYMARTPAWFPRFGVPKHA